AAALIFFGLQALIFQTLRWSTGQEEMRDAASSGCLVQIVGVLLQALLLGFFILLLLPLLLGLQSTISWSSVEPYAMLAARAGIAAALAISVLSFIPGLRQLLAGSPGLEVLIGGGILFRLLSHPYLEKIRGAKIPASALYPNALLCLGYVLIAFLLGRALMLATLRLRPPPSGAPNRFTRLWGPSLDCLIGILVLAMYAGYTALALSQLHP
ncbi:MAG: hypothetical protein K8R69_00560, partial [Deltaproteobacteria bacterium]|nr:hypothetical protein [Deltaproteobacteria bacterium]